MLLATSSLIQILARPNTERLRGGEGHAVGVDEEKLARNVTRTAQYLKDHDTSAASDLCPNFQESRHASAKELMFLAYSSNESDDRSNLIEFLVWMRRQRCGGSQDGRVASIQKASWSRHKVHLPIMQDTKTSDRVQAEEIVRNAYAEVAAKFS